MKNIYCDSLSIGRGAVIEPTAVVRGIAGNAKRVVIGDYTYIGHNVQIICDHLEIGDYGKIHHGSNIHGSKPCVIGHNAWIGQYTIIDCIGGATIGDNVGIGAHSQLWSHIKYGDTLEGCRFLAVTPLSIGNDVWLVGHCVVSPVTIADRAMCLVGSVVTTNLERNKTYAGTPARDVTDKVGPQFSSVTIEQKYGRMCQLLQDSRLREAESIRIVRARSEMRFDDNVSYFNVADRTYTKKLTDHEVAFMKYLLPEKAKFVPVRLG